MNRFFVLLALLTATPALAHPHIFIDAKVTILFDAAGDVTGIQHEWTFDEAFSVWQVQGLDTNGDGVTSEEEMAELAEENMVGLREYGFYTFAGEGAETIRLASMDNARMWNTDGRTVLSFGIEPQGPYRIRDRLEIAINDPEYYVAITFGGIADVMLQNAPANCSATLEPPRELSPELAEQLYSLPPEVTELPPELAAALRGVQGAVVVSCGGGAGAVSQTAAEAVAEVAQAPSAPFGGPPPEPGFTLPRTGFLGWVAQAQADFYTALTAALGRLKADNNAFWVLGGLSFLYGVFHAAGPGHGKVVIASYMLANERQVRRGILLSFLAAMLQSVVAVAFALVAAALLNLTSTAMGIAVEWIGIVSYALVALLGLWLIARKVFGWGHGHRSQPALVDGHEGHDHDHDHHGHDHREDDDHGHAHVVTPENLRGDWREQLAVVLAVGLRPCSGALIVLVFALSQQLLPAGIAATFLMGLGTAITVAVLATLAVGAKGLAQRLAGVNSGRATAIVWWLELGGAAAVFGFGVILLLAAV